MRGLGLRRGNGTTQMYGVARRHANVGTNLVFGVYSRLRFERGRGRKFERGLMAC